MDIEFLVASSNFDTTLEFARTTGTVSNKIGITSCPNQIFHWTTVSTVDGTYRRERPGDQRTSAFCGGKWHRVGQVPGIIAMATGLLSALQWFERQRRLTLRLESHMERVVPTDYMKPHSNV